MGKHSRGENLNAKPFDQNAKPETKAREFDQQYGQNRKPASTHPTLDNHEKRRRRG